MAHVEPDGDRAVSREEMKKSILLPLSLGLLMIGCSRTNTAPDKFSADDPSTAKKPAAEAQAVAAKADATDLAQVASNPTPPSLAGPEGTAEPSKIASETSKVAEIPSLSAAADSTAIAASTTPAAPAAEPVAPEAFKVAANSTSDSLVPAYQADSATKPAMAARDTELTAPESSQVAVDATRVTAETTDNAKSEDRPALAARLTEWKLTANEIKNEFESSGRVMRSKPAAADQPTGPMDGILVSLVKSNLRGHAETAELKIDVAADKGAVTLNGTVQSLDQIGQVVAIALDTEGVTQATSAMTLASAR